MTAADVIARIKNRADECFREYQVTATLEAFVAYQYLHELAGELEHELAEKGETK